MLRSSLLVPIAGLAGLFLAGACLGPRAGYERASAAAEQTAVYRADLVQLRDQVTLTAAALHTLVENPTAAPRSNRETFETLAREVENLSDLAARTRRSYGRMDARAERFFGRWVEDSATIQAADLRQRAEERRTALQANYDKLAQGQSALDGALAKHVDELRDLCTYLEHDLTAAGIASARTTIERVFADGEALADELSQLAHASDDARAALAPLQEQAPAPAARAGEEGRVR